VEGKKRKTKVEIQELQIDNRKEKITYHQSTIVNSPMIRWLDEPMNRLFLQRLNPDLHFHTLASASQGEALYRGHIAVIAAPGESNVSV